MHGMRWETFTWCVGPWMLRERAFVSWRVQDYTAAEVKNKYVLLTGLVQCVKSTGDVIGNDLWATHFDNLSSSRVTHVSAHQAPHSWISACSQSSYPWMYSERGSD